MASEMEEIQPNDEPYNIFTRNTAIPKTEPVEGFIVVEKESGRVIKISHTAKRILNLNGGNNTKPSFMLFDLFHISEDDWLRLQGPVPFDTSCVKLEPVSQNADCYKTKAVICNCTKYDTLSICVEALFYGIQVRPRCPHVPG